MMGAAASQLSRRVDNYMRECVFEASSASGARVQGRPTTGFFGRPAFFAGLIITLLRPQSRRPSGTHGHAAQDTALQRHTPHPSHATSASLGLQSPQNSRGSGNRKDKEASERNSFLHSTKPNQPSTFFFIQQNPTSTRGWAGGADARSCPQNPLSHSSSAPPDPVHDR